MVLGKIIKVPTLLLGIDMARETRVKGMSQRQLADRLGTISEQGIHRWETGRTLPSAGILPDLASALSVSIEALVHAIVETPRRDAK